MRKIIVLFFTIQFSVFAIEGSTENIRVSTETVGVEAMFESNNDITLYVNKNFKTSDIVLIDIEDLGGDDWELISPNTSSISLNIGGSISYEMRYKAGNEDVKRGIINIREFECKLLIYVDQPGNGDDGNYVEMHATFNDKVKYVMKKGNNKFLDVGHTMWMFKLEEEFYLLIEQNLQINLNVKTGFYPTDSVLNSYILPGVISQPDLHTEYEVKKEFNIHLEDFVAGLKKVDELKTKTPDYNLFDNNCTSVAIGIGSECGVSLPDGISDINSIHIEKMREEFGSFEYTTICNPGMFGLQLKEME